MCGPPFSGQCHYIRACESFKFFTSEALLLKWMEFAVGGFGVAIARVHVAGGGFE